MTDQVFYIFLAAVLVGIWCSGIAFAYISCKDKLFTYAATHTPTRSERILPHLACIMWPFTFLILLPVALYVMTGLDEVLEEIADMIPSRRTLHS